MMTKKEALSNFRKYDLPIIRERYESDGIVDKPARREEWNNYIDYLQSDGLISQSQADTWTNPY